MYGRKSNFSSKTDMGNFEDIIGNVELGGRYDRGGRSTITILSGRKFSNLK